MRTFSKKALSVLLSAIMVLSIFTIIPFSAGAVIIDATGFLENRIAYYSFDNVENTDGTITSGAAVANDANLAQHNGTVSYTEGSSVTYVSDGAKNGALHFTNNGTNADNNAARVKITDPAVLSNTVDWSVSLWVKPETVTDSELSGTSTPRNLQQSLMSYFPNGGDYNADANTNRGIFINKTVIAYFGYKFDPAHCFSSSAGVAATEWQHITVTHAANAQTMSVYKNGTFNSSINQSNLATNANYTAFAPTSQIGGQNFNGDIDEVMIFNKVLTADEVTAVYEDIIPVNTLLSEKITEAQTYQSGFYTAATYAELQEKIVAAQAIVGNSESSQVEIDLALSNLVTAITNLVKKTNIMSNLPDSALSAHNSNGSIYTPTGRPLSLMKDSEIVSAEGKYTMAPGNGYFQINLGGLYNISAFNLYKYADNRTYYDTVIATSLTSGFENQTIIYTNDVDDTWGFGYTGNETEFAETPAGLSRSFDTVTTQYIRIYGRGNSRENSSTNMGNVHVVEFEVYGEVLTEKDKYNTQLKVINDLIANTDEYTARSIASVTALRDGITNSLGETPDDDAYINATSALKALEEKLVSRWIYMADSATAFNPKLTEVPAYLKANASNTKTDWDLGWNGGVSSCPPKAIWVNSTAASTGGRVAMAQGEAFTTTFVGTSVEFYANMHAVGITLGVYIDDVYVRDMVTKGTATSGFASVFSETGLSRGMHTISLKCDTYSATDGKMEFLGFKFNDILSDNTVVNCTYKNPSNENESFSLNVLTANSYSEPTANDVVATLIASPLNQLSNIKYDYTIEASGYNADTYTFEIPKVVAQYKVDYTVNGVSNSATKNYGEAFDITANDTSSDGKNFAYWKLNDDSNTIISYDSTFRLAATNNYNITAVYEESLTKQVSAYISEPIQSVQTYNGTLRNVVEIPVSFPGLMDDVGGAVSYGIILVNPSTSPSTTDLAGYVSDGTTTPSGVLIRPSSATLTNKGRYLHRLLFTGSVSACNVYAYVELTDGTVVISNMQSFNAMSAIS